MSTLVPLSSNSRGQESSSPAGVTSWPLVAGDGVAGCARNPAEHVTAATSATIHDDINPRRRVRGPGLQDVVGRVPSRGGTVGVMYSYQCTSLFQQEETEETDVAEKTKTWLTASLASVRESV